MAILEFLQSQRLGEHVVADEILLNAVIAALAEGGKWQMAGPSASLLNLLSHKAQCRQIPPVRDALRR